jgi:hypothetical protein
LRQEDKEVDGFELEREAERGEGHKDGKDAANDEAVALVEGPHSDREHAHTGVIGSAMHAILERGHLGLDQLGLPQRELRALEALKTAVEARDPHLDTFVYASDRSKLLEQALAVLQPDLANLQQLGGVAFRELWHEIADLRERLGSLKDAQRAVRRKKKPAVKAEEGDKDDDKDQDDDGKGDDDASLTGPEREIEKPPSSLTGPERKEEPKPASSLTGPERKEEPKPSTTLGDPKEIAAAAQPWWKR